MGVPEIRYFLSHLANDRDVAASMQDVAFNALHFLYRNILAIELLPIQGVYRSQRLPRLPEVFTHDEVKNGLAAMQATNHLMASLIYGSDLRLIKGAHPTRLLTETTEPVTHFIETVRSRVAAIRIIGIYPN